MFPYAFYAKPAGSFAVPIPAPATPPDGGVPVVAVFSKDWLPLIVGSLTQLLLQSTWDNGDPAFVADMQSQVFCLMQLIAGAVPMSDFIRFQQSACGLEVSYDGGTTYAQIYDGNVCVLDEIGDGTLAPGNGSSGTPTTANPPWPAGTVPPGQDGSCLTAANISDIWTQQWTQMEAGFSAGQTAIQMTAVLAGLIAVFIPIESVVFVFLGEMDAIFAVGTAAFADLIASATTDVLQCAIFCHCADDGSITATQFGAILADINASSLDALTKGVMSLWVSAQGPVGLMRMGAAAGVDTATCSCGCQVFDLDVSVTSLAPVYIGAPTISGQSYEITFSGQFQVIAPGWMPEADCWGYWYFNNLGTLAYMSYADVRGGGSSDLCPDVGPQMDDGSGFAYVDFATRTDTHIYTMNVTGNGNPFGFQFQDCNFPGNSGSFHVHIKQI